MRPPRAGRLDGAGLPLLQRRGQLVVGPVLVLVGDGGVDHTGDVAAASHGEGHRPAEQSRALVDRAGRGDVVLFRGLHIDRRLHLLQIDLDAVQLKLTLGHGVLAIEFAQVEEVQGPRHPGLV